MLVTLGLEEAVPPGPGQGAVEASEASVSVLVAGNGARRGRGRARPALPDGRRTPQPPLALTCAPAPLSGISSWGGPCCSQPCVLPPLGPHHRCTRPE